jgi:hypothetical protein
VSRVEEPRSRGVEESSLSLRICKAECQDTKPVARVLLHLLHFRSNLRGFWILPTDSTQSQIAKPTMATTTYNVLEDVDEVNATLKARLLPVENRPLRRVLDHFLSPSSPLFNAPAADQADEARGLARDEILLELANLESAIVRIQLLRKSNEQERARYEAEKVRILEEQAAIRANNVELRLQLEEAQRTLSIRKEYDVLADKITSNKMLRPREDQSTQIEKLKGEIQELEEETLEYKKVWAERREQFARVVDEGQQMLRLIKGDKEDHKDAMETGEDDAGSTIGTPRIDGSGTPYAGEDTQDGDRPAASSLLRVGSPALTASRAPSPSRPGHDGNRADGDVTMQEAPDTPAAQTNLTSELEEGEAEDDGSDDGEIDEMETN